MEGETVFFNEYCKDILAYHCPRWNELPDVELYMDQVVSVLEKQLAIFSDDKNSKTITSSMINNYVKQKVVTPPVKKRYTKYHLAYLYVVCLMKQIMSISDICVVIEMLLDSSHSETAYNTFCDELESAIKAVFSGDSTATSVSASSETDDKKRTLKAVTLAFANLIYAQRLIQYIRR